jgi:hypothetical protein
VCECAGRHEHEESDPLLPPLSALKGS